jgi:hypothetical protein
MKHAYIYKYSEKFQEGDERDMSNLAVQALRDGAWNNLNTISAAQRLAGALENRAFNHPNVLIDEEVFMDI